MKKDEKSIKIISLVVCIFFGVPIIILLVLFIYINLKPNRCKDYGKEYTEYVHYNNGDKTVSCCKNEEECIVIEGDTNETE